MHLVFANGLPADMITVHRFAGTVDLTDANGQALPMGVDLVCSIGPVLVTDRTGNTIARGNF